MSDDPRLTAGPSRHRVAFWGAVVLAVLVTVAGAVVAVTAWRRTAGPDGAVRAYFAAVAAGDAARALAWGTVPPGDRSLLRADVLREQLRLAPLDEVSASTVSSTGDRARVRVSYRLRFAAGAYRQVVSTVGVHDGADGWRLDAAAVSTQVLTTTAGARVTLAGRAVPPGEVLLFPGAVPARVDTPYLAVDPDHGDVAFGGEVSTAVELVVSDAGRRAAVAAVRAAVAACVTAGRTPDPRCPLPDGQVVPGSVRGTVTGDDLTVRLVAGRAGLLEVSGTVKAHGQYRQLGFDNRVTARLDTDYTLPVAARLYAVPPLTAASVAWVTRS